MEQVPAFSIVPSIDFFLFLYTSTKIQGFLKIFFYDKIFYSVFLVLLVNIDGNDKCYACVTDLFN